MFYTKGNYFPIFIGKYKNLFLIAVSAVIIFWGTGCNEVINETLYLQQVKVRGPITQPPIFIADKNDSSKITITPRFFFNSEEKVTGSVDREQTSYTLTDDTISFPDGNNFEWTLPQFYGGLELDIPLSSKFSISGGINYSQVDGEPLFGFRTGIGIGGYSEYAGVRIELGLNWQQYYYNAYTKIVQEIDPAFGDPYTRTVYYHDIDKSTNLNHYISLTISTLIENFPMNGFINLAYTRQSVLDYEPRDISVTVIDFDEVITTDLRGEASVTYFSFAPGVYFYLSSSVKLVIAARMYFQSELDGATKDYYLIPSAQFDFRL